MATVQTPIAEGDRTPNREIPPMSYPRRVRAAARLAWKTLRTGQHLTVEAYLNGARDGMDSMRSTMHYRLAQRIAAQAQDGAK